MWQFRFLWTIQNFCRQDNGNTCMSGSRTWGSRHLEPFSKWAGAGATVPLLGFGNTLWKGMKEAIDKEGFIGLFKGGLPPVPIGYQQALIFGYAASLIFKPKMK